MNFHRYTVFDIETTGLYPQRGHRIIEIGAVSIQNDAIANEFSILISCGRNISKKAQSINGITHDMLINQPSPEEALTRFIDFISNSILIAHNAKFDIRFLRYELSRLGLKLLNRYICTLELSRKKYPDLPNHKLETVAGHLLGEKMNGFQHHRALDDARLTAMVWLEMSRNSERIPRSFARD